MLVIPIQPVPSQQLQCVLAGQNCQIAIYEKKQGVFVDLNSNGFDISIARLAINGIKLTQNYSGFSGNLLFIDTQGTDDPTASGMGSRFQLVYVTAAEVALLIWRSVVSYEGRIISVDGTVVSTGGSIAVDDTVVSTTGSLSVDGGI